MSYFDVTLLEMIDTTADLIDERTAHEQEILLAIVVAQFAPSAVGSPEKEALIQDMYKLSLTTGAGDVGRRLRDIAHKHIHINTEITA